MNHAKLLCKLCQPMIRAVNLIEANGAARPRKNTVKEDLVPNAVVLPKLCPEPQAWYQAP